jgi:hypothetical protein
MPTVEELRVQNTGQQDLLDAFVLWIVYMLEFGESQQT